MLSLKLIKALRVSSQRVLMQIIAQKTTSTTCNDKDPAPFFFDTEVQNILKILIRPDHEIVFRKRLDCSKLEEPKFKFMTEEQLQEARKEAEEKMWKMLQIPPFVKIRKDKIKILSKDPAIKGYSENNFVFTDITYGVSNKNRLIVVREPNGTLRTANYEERDRLNQIYFPISGREVEVPKMFEENNLKAILKREDYEFILNRACLQFDPDHPEFHRVTQITYNEVNTKFQFQKLRSTRHYGSLVFYLAWSKNITNLLFENISLRMIEDAALVIKLYYILNGYKLKENNNIQIIKYYLINDGSEASELKYSFEMYCQLLKEEEEVRKGIEEAHIGKISDQINV